jgi:hypothetical protein
MIVAPVYSTRADHHRAPISRSNAVAVSIVRNLRGVRPLPAWFPNPSRSPGFHAGGCCTNGFCYRSPITPNPPPRRLPARRFSRRRQRSGPVTETVPVRPSALPDPCRLAARAGSDRTTVDAVFRTLVPPSKPLVNPGAPSLTGAAGPGLSPGWPAGRSTPLVSCSRNASCPALRTAPPHHPPRQERALQ